MYILGTLLFDKLIHKNLYEIIKKDCENGKFLSDEVKNYKSLTLDNFDSNEVEGFQWIWKAALGDATINIDPNTIPDKKLWNLDPREITKQCGLAWFDLGAIYMDGCKNLNIQPSPEIAKDLFYFAGEIHNVPEAFFWLSAQIWPSNKELLALSDEEREKHPSIQLMLKGFLFFMFFLLVFFLFCFSC